MNHFMREKNLSIILIFLAIIIHLSKSTDDLNLSDDNYEKIHNHQYSWRSERHHQSPEIHDHKWFHNRNNHINGEPSAMGHFFGIAFSGRFPFDSKFKPFLMPSIPSPPHPPSPPYLNRAPEFTYWHKNYEQTNHNNRNNDHNQYGNKNSNSKGKYWSYNYNSGHSYHHSYDNGVDQNHDWNQHPDERKFNWDKDFSISRDFPRLRSHHFSHRTSVPKVDGLAQSIPSMDELINAHLSRDNGFVKEHRFSWDLVENKPFKSESRHFSW